MMMMSIKSLESYVPFSLHVSQEGKGAPDHSEFRTGRLQPRLTLQRKERARGEYSEHEKLFDSVVLATIED
jgi:hypothetical protein